MCLGVKGLAVLGEDFKTPCCLGFRSSDEFNCVPCFFPSFAP